MRARTAGALVGVVFGVALSWSGMTSPDVIRQALLFEKSYLFLFFASAVLTAFVGQRVLLAVKARALLTGEPIAWQTVRPQRRHIVGSVLFGIGWGVADVCPGPVATQLGQGIAWSLLTLTGITIGITLFRRREERVEAAPAEPSRAGRVAAAAG
jgi:uncharacterized membrane protein YedE/YeeE